jgi:hypothetical protein
MGTYCLSADDDIYVIDVEQQAEPAAH